MRPLTPDPEPPRLREKVPDVNPVPARSGSDVKNRPHTFGPRPSVDPVRPGSPGSVKLDTWRGSSKVIDPVPAGSYVIESEDDAEPSDA